MFYAISWFLSFFLLALWSLTCWGLHAMAVWAISSAGAMAGGASAVNAVLVPDWIRGWIPPELAREFGAMIASAGPMVQSALEAVPALSGAVTVLAWGVWGLGTAVVVALAIGAHALIALLQRRRAGHDVPRATVVR